MWKEDGDDGARGGDVSYRVGWRFVAKVQAWASGREGHATAVRGCRSEMCWWCGFNLLPDRSEVDRP